MESLERNAIRSMVRDCTVGVGGDPEELIGAALASCKAWIAECLGVDTLTHEQRRLIESEWRSCVMDTQCP